MKHLCLLTLTLTLALKLSAQHKYIPFPDSNAIWVIRTLNEFGQEKGGGQYFIQKDTVINAIEYKKVVGTNDSTLYTPGGKQESWFAFRNDTFQKQVFIYNRSAKKEELLYDFSLKENDTFPQNSYGKNGRYGSGVITNIDTILIDNNEHLVFYVHTESNGDLYPYIEGFGSLAGPISQPYFFEGGSELVCLMLGKDRVPYYTAPGLTCKLFHYTGVEERSLALKIRIFPDPVVEESVIELQSAIDNIDKLVIYDVNGRKIFERSGIAANRYDIGNIAKNKGIYYYQITTEKNAVLTGKFIR